MLTATGATLAQNDAVSALLFITFCGRFDETISFFCELSTA
jgi:hypothetical protein